ncbi:hypothetical protein TanjilG_20829 [Lupinus angustifolius]|uniref:Uncharacterized protein n=1 Tax=Lupinus angustifolius TaxID=3871 RepID=A0A4P1QSG7_LUPAN|nr:hypothetical protein TanjilG_20829 [Lupinus angustifolius]
MEELPTFPGELMKINDRSGSDVSESEEDEEWMGQNQNWGEASFSNEEDADVEIPPALTFQNPLGCTESSISGRVDVDSSAFLVGVVADKTDTQVEGELIIACSDSIVPESNLDSNYFGASKESKSETFICEEGNNKGHKGLDKFYELYDQGVVGGNIEPHSLRTNIQSRTDGKLKGKLKAKLISDPFMGFSIGKTKNSKLKQYASNSKKASDPNGKGGKGLGGN